MAYERSCSFCKSMSSGGIRAVLSFDAKMSLKSEHQQPEATMNPVMIPANYGQIGA